MAVSSAHWDRHTVCLFLRDRLSAAEAGRYLRHLLEGCPPCARLLAEEMDRKVRAPPEGYAPSCLAAAEFVVGREAPLARERIAAPGRAKRLLDLPPGQRELLVREDPNFRTWGLCERLIQESRQAVWRTHPDSLEELARAALLVGGHLDRTFYGEPFVADLLAQAHGSLGNACRLRSDFVAARLHLKRGRELLSQGSGETLEEVNLGSLEASLLSTLGHFEQVVELLERLRGKLVPYDEHQLEAKLLVQEGIALGYYDPAGAVEVHRRALELIDASVSPRLALCTRQSFIWCLNDAGRSAEALMHLQRSRSLFQQFPDRWAQLHLRWTEAHIAFSLGYAEEAQEMFDTLWYEALDLSLPLQTALIALEMIEVQIALENYEDASGVAHRLIRLFESWQVHHRAMEAVLLLVDALKHQQASGDMVHSIARYLNRAWKNPSIELPFADR